MLKEKKEEFEKLMKEIHRQKRLTDNQGQAAASAATSMKKVVNVVRAANMMRQPAGRSVRGNVMRVKKAPGQ